MKKSFITIHGLQNKPEPEQLCAWWEQAMLEGLSVNCGIHCSDLPIKQVYWSDKMDRLPKKAPKGYKPAPKGALKRYKEHWFDSLKEEVFELGDDFWDCARDAVGMGPVTKIALNNNILSDLYKYYSDNSKRDQLRRMFKEAVYAEWEAGNALYVIAHSMGSIIAYDALREIGRENSSVVIEHFISIGSPLGLPLVKGTIRKENALVRTPSNVRKWTNQADRRDPVAFDAHLADDFEANDRGVKVVDDLVLNDWKGIHHKSYGYLRTPEFSDLLRTFI